MGTGDDRHPAFDVVAIAASAGGLSAVGELLTALPADLPAAVLVVQHLDPSHRSLMSEILGRRTQLPVSEASAGEHAERGHVYIAPPDRHLLLAMDRTIELSQAELVQYVRPSATLLFESVAGSCNERAIAIVLTGTGSDAAKGCRAIKERGGVVIVQDPDTAEYRGMPEAAIATGCADYVLPLDEIPRRLTVLLQGAGEHGG